MKRNTKLIIAGLSVSLVLAFFLSPLASSLPDGLEKAIEKLIQEKPLQETGSPAFTPLPDYGVPGLKSEWLSTGLAGVIGTVVVFAFALFLGKALARKKSSAPAGRKDD